ncbi:MAG: branched-chain amino acid ABC transporter permease [Candidatus Cloacimonetes bacterium]|nr:branched-chain amino acid ABC transporter permease [Candidatus Cloacimonadota bacterium]MCF8306302.1 branched-chain amino acid ABC transporter permease [Ignavibacteriales bacterium]MCF8316023.1 branched-chain amino acid ABC transporter permease [Ignavibacteriales bacterium]MCF8437617.1 branched-chain amino acid ABC transporter permease [Ignavibacteriales bacterium]
MNYVINILIILQIYIILALSLNLKTGFTGLLSLCQAAFYGTGAYLTSILMVDIGLNFFTALFFAIIINITLNASITTWSAGRLRNLYFTLGTIALQIVFFGVIYNWQALTRGPFGIPGIPKPELAGLIFNTPLKFFILTLFFTASAILFFYWFAKTPLCKLLECTRDDEVWLTVLGKRPAYYKFVSISITVVFATIAGALYATFTSYIDPTSFTLDESILVLTIILVGGTGNIMGPVSGALIYVLLPEALRFVNMPDSIAANARMIIYALILIFIVRLKPNGLFGKFEIRG